MRFRRTARFLILPLLAGFSLFACGGGGGDSAPAPPPAPTVTTTAASAVAVDNATLNGTVNPNAQATTAWLEWGTDNTLSAFTKTADQLVGAGSTAVTVSATVPGLSPGTTYYYRAAASNASGTAKGAITSFTTATPNSPPTVTTIAADNVTIAGATLHGSVIPNALATSALFEWGTDANLATFTSTPGQSLGSGTTSVPISQALSSLSSSTTYYFRVAATNSIGTSKGNILSFSTVAQPPAATTQAATSIAATTATLNGNVNPNGLATNAQFEYGTDNTMAVVTTTPPQNIGSGTTGQAITAPIISLAPATRYYFRVSATNSAGTTKGTTVFFDTLQNPPPVADAGPAQTVFMGQTVTLDGSASTDAFGTITSYQWTQIAGPNVGAVDNTDPIRPKFTAPAVNFPSQDVQFQLTVTDNRGLSGTDNVTITDKWGFFDDFSTNTIGTYTVTQTVGTGGTVTHDAAGQRAQVNAPNDNVVQFSHPIPASLPAGQNGVLTLTFAPTAVYTTHGGVWVRLLQSPNTYYEVANFDYPGGPGTIPPGAIDVGRVTRVVNGSVSGEVQFPTGYDQGVTYPITITYSATQLTLQAFGQNVTLPAGTSLTVNTLEIETGHQDAFYDNIKLEAGP